MPTDTSHLTDNKKLLSTLSETDLITAAQQGNANAFEKLLANHFDAMFAFAFRWCGHKSDAEDITQNAAIKLANSIAQFRFEANFRSWLYRIVINCAKDWQKSQHRYQPLDLTESEANNSNKDYELSNAPIISIRCREVLKELDKMGVDIKETVLLVYIAGFTHKEAATLLKVKESTVSWRLHTARNALQATEQQAIQEQEAHTYVR